MHTHIRILPHLAFALALFAAFWLPKCADGQPLSLSCGSGRESTDDDGRKWGPDSEYISGNSLAGRALHQDASVPQVPYMDARIFTSEASYKFPVKANTRYYVRFHFYPAEYQGFNISNAFFAVDAGGINLLANFSAALTAQALTQAYLIKEYSLAPIESELLDVKFMPAGKPDGAFAFVNGIELVPIADDLFDNATVIGFSDQNMDITSSNLQTMYRLNVAGQYISPSKDSGSLLRTWYDDLPYLYGAISGVGNSVARNFTVEFGDLPKSLAPEDVYRSARSMGNTNQMNLNYNLTWVFQVDVNFSYIVRLHFCEIDLTKVNQKAFNIFINRRPAETNPSPFDIIAWSKAKGVPIYRDYVIPVFSADGNVIRLDLFPSTFTHPEFYDASVNGIEIFKINNQNKSLAGPNPEMSEMMAKKAASITQKGFTSPSHIGAIGGAAGGAAGFALVAAICIAVYKRKTRVSGYDNHTSSWLPIYGNSHSSTGKSMSGKSNSTNLSTLAQGLCRHFSLPEIKHATKNFDESNVIGVGGFGKVYKGVIDHTTKVAIKRSNPQSEQGVNEFQTEIEMLSKLRHKHLVSLIGFCEEDGEMCLVYDYMALGTFREHLYNTKKPKLSWKQRLEICIGAARGLHYLHTGAKYTIIHRDVKTTNILVDENWVAKVSDFGLSKTGPGMDKGHVSTVVKGSFGYLDPEYFKRQQLTEKSDVYSFGVVLFEALCARPALNPQLPKEQVSLADWALHCHRKGTLQDIIDPQIKSKIRPECLKKFSDTALKCLSDSGLDRPSMGDVLWNLEFALQLQENPESSSRGSKEDSHHGSDGGSNRGAATHQSQPSIGSSSSSSIGSDDSDPIFSQLVNPKGR